MSNVALHYGDQKFVVENETAEGVMGLFAGKATGDLVTVVTKYGDVTVRLAEGVPVWAKEIKQGGGHVR